MATVQDLASLTDPVTSHVTGHGIAPFDNSGWMASDIAAEIVAHNNIEWAIVRWDWRQLETAKGTYATGATVGFNAATTWPYLPKDLLDYFAGHADPAVVACKVIIQIEDRCFNGMSGKSDITFSGNDITSAGGDFANYGTNKSGGAFVKVSGSANNDGNWTVDTQPNANTLTVIEALTLEATPAASVDVLQNPIPDYMDDEGYALSNSANPPSITGARYRQYYMDRLGDCYDAIYDAFRAEPNFGGISSQETAGAITASPGFDHTTYRDELMHLIKRASIAAKNHIFMFYQNYAGDPTPGDANLDLIAGWMRAYHNVYLCAPNLNSKTSVMGRVYGRYNLYPSIIKQHCAVQGNDYSSSSNGGNTLEQIYDIANGTNISATGTWLNDAMGQGTTNLIDGIPWTTAAGEYDYDPDAVAIIDANAGPFR